MHRRLQLQWSRAENSFTRMPKARPILFLTKYPPQMRYSIGSISKQFTAAAILILREQGKLSLDDAVGKHVDGLTRGGDVTIRQILSHTGAIFGSRIVCGPIQWNSATSGCLPKSY